MTTSRGSLLVNQLTPPRRITTTHRPLPALWANLHLLFWLSLIPFATSWIGEYPFSLAPTAVYGVALVMAAIAWYMLQVVIIRAQGGGSALARALGSDIKGKLSAPLYLAGILLAFVDTGISDAIHVLVA